MVHAYVSEYVVKGADAGDGSLLAALAEAGFVIKLERNWWNQDAIVFDSSQHYGTPSYWMEHCFKGSNGATLLISSLQSNMSIALVASAIIWKGTENHKRYLRIKVVIFGSRMVTLRISIAEVEMNTMQLVGSSKLELISSNLMDEKSFAAPNKIFTNADKVHSIKALGTLTSTL